jgi:RimJ/RimL family protein N-acetyltransferase/uncharacterized damage-inducible protein DinB
MTLQTSRLRLIPATTDLIRADLAGPAALGAALGHETPSGWPPQYYDAPAMEATLAQLEKDPVGIGWALHYIVGPDGRLAGIVGYKGRPGPDGTVEIGYSVMEEYQRQGIAAEAAGALVARAFGAPEVRRVIAETLPALLPSIRVLEKNGFRLIGEGSTPGVIRFELTRVDYEAGRRHVPEHLRHLIRLLGHQSWADARALDALERAPVPVASALALLAHVLGAEHVWLARLRGAPAERAVWPELGIPECRQLAAENEAGYREFIFQLDPAGLRRVVEYRNSAGQELSTAVEDILLHVFLHGAYHRGQVAQRLRLAGATPEPTDYVAFARGTPAAVRQPGTGAAAGGAS